jgi:hypothetical protein
MADIAAVLASSDLRREHIVCVGLGRFYASVALSDGTLSARHAQYFGRAGNLEIAIQLEKAWLNSCRVVRRRCS